MKNKWQAPFRRLLALLLCVASLLGMFPALTLGTKAATGIVMSGDRTVATGAADPVVTNMHPIKLEQKFYGDNLRGHMLMAVENPTYQKVLSFDSQSQKHYAGSISYSSSANQLGTYYTTVSDGRTYLHLDQSLRRDALWIGMQNYNPDNHGQKMAGVDIAMSYYGFESTASNGTVNYSATKTTETNVTWYTPFDYAKAIVNGRATGATLEQARQRVYIGFWMQKGPTYWDQAKTDPAHGEDFWYEEGAYRHLVTRYASDGYPFSNTYDASLDGNATEDTWYHEAYQIDMLEDGTCIIYWANHDLNDVRVLRCDSSGNWGIMRYRNGTGTNSTTETWVNGQSNMLTAIANDVGNRHKLYSYSETKIESDGTIAYKELSYSGKTHYSVPLNTSNADILNTISSNIQVFDPQNNNLRVPYQSGSTRKEGYYHLELPYNFSSASYGSYTVDIVYNGKDGSETTIGSVTVVVDALRNATVNSCAAVGVISRSDSRMGTVYEHNSGSGSTATAKNTKPTFTLSTNKTVTITKDMLFDSNGNPVDTSVAGKKQGLHVIYQGKTITTNFTLHVTASTLAQDQKEFPNPGSVGVSKTATDFSNSGTSTIELSAKGTSTTRGVDMIIMMDLSSSMQYTVTGGSTTRVDLLKTSLENLVSKINGDAMLRSKVNIAIADFGDLDHYEFEDAVLDKKHRTWPQIETRYGRQEGEYTGFYGKAYINNYNNELFNHLNFVLGADDTTYINSNGETKTIQSQTFNLFPTKYDLRLTVTGNGATNSGDAVILGKLKPRVYTGSKMINSGAFATAADLNSNMSTIKNAITYQSNMALGTNYDVGLEYAYRLAYARQKANLAAGLDRDITVIFMSDGAAMQYNYFSGRSQLNSWNKYLLGETDSLLSNGTTDDYWKWDLTDMENVIINYEYMDENFRRVLHDMHMLKYSGRLLYSENNVDDGSGDSGKIGSHSRGDNAVAGTDVYVACDGGDTNKVCWNASQTQHSDALARSFAHCFNNQHQHILTIADVMKLAYENRKKLAGLAALSQSNYTTLNTYPTNGTMTSKQKSIWTDQVDKATASAGDTWYANLIKNMRDPNNTAQNSDGTYNYETPSPYWYFYNAEGKNWWAEAIKGQTNQIYPVINKWAIMDTNEWSGTRDAWNNPITGDVARDFYYGEVRNYFSGTNTSGLALDGKEYVAGFKGLGLKIYTIGFDLQRDNAITKETAEATLQHIASRDASGNIHYYPATTDLSSVMNGILYAATASATNARYADSMAQYHHLYMEAGATIKVMTYDLVSGTPDANGNYAANVGTRTGSAKMLETITFNQDGSATSKVYKADGTTVDSTKTITAATIASTGLVKGTYVTYNTTTTQTTDGTITIPGESFYWNIGTLDYKEYVLQYTVKRDNDKLSNVTTNYPTNGSQLLSFTDHMGNPATKDPGSPEATGYTNAQTRYQFYLVNTDGKPIAASGQVDSPADATKVGDPVTVDVAKDGSFVQGGSVSGDNHTLTVTPTMSDLSYVIYESEPSYTVTSVVNGQCHALSKKEGDGTTLWVGDTTNLDNTGLFNNIVYIAVVAKGAKPDTVVVDYGLPVDINVLANDYLTGGTNTIYGYVKPNGLGQNVSIKSSQTTAPTQTTTFTDTWAKVETTETTESRWTGQAMNLSNYYQYGYWVSHTPTGKNTPYYYGSTVTVIPATSIYYEDSFVTFASGNLITSGWSLVTWGTANGTAAGATQNQDRPSDQGSAIDHNKIYGYDDAYTTTTTYSGSARWAQVSPKNPARAIFTFTGTGFDLISMTSSTTGSIVAYVYEGVVTKFDDPSTDMILDTKTWDFEKDANGIYKHWEGQVNSGKMVMPIKNIAVDSYYSAGSLYQVPVIKCDNLPYGTYTVELLVAYDDWFNEGQYPVTGTLTQTDKDSGNYFEGRDKNDETYYHKKFDFYLDSIRVYNPAGIADSTDGFSNEIKEAYLADGEGWPRYQELRNMILSPTVTFKYENEKYPDRITGFADAAFGTDGKPADLSGMLFIDGDKLGQDGKFTYTQYAHWGPNNEVYLNTDDQLIFKLNEKKYKEKAFTNAIDFGEVAKIQIGMRGLSDGAVVTLNKVTYNNAGQATLQQFGEPIPLSASDQYFNIIGLKNEYVQITVTGAAAAITNIKVTHTSMPSDYEVEMGQTKSRSAAVLTGSTLNVNAASMASLFTVNAVETLELLDALNNSQEAPATLTPKYASLSFKDLIHCNIYFDADRYSGISTEELGMAVFASNDANGTVDTASYVVNGATLVDGMYKVSTKGIPAKNLGDTIYFKVFAREADGSYSYSKLMAYSALEYANFLISSGSDMDKALAAAMLNYGAEAQKYFGYNTEALMNANVTEEAKALLSAYSIDDLDALAPMDESKTGVFTDNGGFGQKYPTVSFKGAFSINFYVQPAETVDGDVTFYYWTQDTCSTAAQLTADNADGTAVMAAADGLYSASVDGIFAKDLDKTVYAAAVYQSNGVTYCTGILPYSVAEYARSFANTADDFAPFANATGIYGSVAKAYFGN